jgi:hypothetical protein
MTPRRRFWLEWLGAFLFCAALCGYFQFQTPYLAEEDGYFHIKFAWLLRHHGLFLDGFPWARFSLWRDGFSDGALLFHCLLIPFTFGDLALGGKLAAVLESAFMFSSFFAILTLNKARARLYWFGLLLLGGAFFWWRMLAPRPQVLSATFLLWSLHFLINGKRRPFAALSFLYPLAYVAAFLPQVFAVARWLYLKATAQRADGRLVLAGLGAYALAMIVHPYFPKNLTFFYVQNLYVMFLGMTHKVDLSLAGEILPLDTRQFVGAHLPLIVHLLGLSLVFMHRRSPLSERTRSMFLMALITILLTCGSKRFVEYSVPVTTLFCALLFTDVFAGYGLKDFAREYGRAGRVFAFAWLAALLGAAGAEAVIVRRGMAAVKPPRLRALAASLAAAAPPGAFVYTCDWDEPPELLFFADQYAYPVLMDPTFMYYWDPAIWRKWSDVANARLEPAETARALKETFGARFGVCGSKFSGLRYMMEDRKRFKILAENENGFVFETL